MVIFIEIIHGMLFTACYVQVARDQFDHDQDHVWGLSLNIKKILLEIKTTGRWNFIFY